MSDTLVLFGRAFGKALKLVLSEKREALSSVQHDIWAHWIHYQFSVCVQNEDGSLTIPADKVARWTRQMNTPYSELTEREKDSDRKQADKVISVLTIADGER